MNSTRNKKILASLDIAASKLILQSISRSYGITLSEAYDEVTCNGAEALLDYLEHAERTATRVLIQRRFL